MIQAIIISSLIMLLTIINKERLALKKQLSRATNKQAQRQRKEQQRQERQVLEKQQRQERQVLATQQKEYNRLKLQGFNDELIEQIMSGSTHIDLTKGSKKEVAKYK